MRQCYLDTQVGRLLVWVSTPSNARIELPSLTESYLHIIKRNGEWKRADGKPATPAQQVIINKWSCETTKLGECDSPVMNGAGRLEMNASRNTTDHFVIIDGVHWRMTDMKYRSLLKQIEAGHKPDPALIRCVQVNSPVVLDNISPRGATILLGGGTIEQAMNAAADIPAIVSKSEEKRIKMGRDGELKAFAGSSEGLQPAEGVTSVAFDEAGNDERNNIAD